MFVLESEKAARRMAEAHATKEKELMFTTYRYSVAFWKTSGSNGHLIAIELLLRDHGSEHNFHPWSEVFLSPEWKRCCCSFTHKKKYNAGAVNQARHIWENLRRIKRLSNSIIITVCSLARGLTSCLKGFEESEASPVS